LSFYKLLSAINAGVWGAGFFVQVGPVVHLALVFAIVLLIVDHIEQRKTTRPIRNADLPIRPEPRSVDRGELLRFHPVRFWSSSTGFPANLSTHGRFHVVRTSTSPLVMHDYRPLIRSTSTGPRAARL
jgi:hypothetical protein